VTSGFAVLSKALLLAEAVHAKFDTPFVSLLSSDEMCRPSHLAASNAPRMAGYRTLGCSISKRSFRALMAVG
jgi:hypothetical protein